MGRFLIREDGFKNVSSFDKNFKEIVFRRVQLRVYWDQIQMQIGFISLRQTPEVGPQCQNCSIEKWGGVPFICYINLDLYRLGEDEG